MTPVHLQQWIQHPEALNRDTLYELRTLVARYPYFQSLRLLLSSFSRAFFGTLERS